MMDDEGYAGAWLGHELAREEERWMHQVSPAEIDELEAAHAHARATQARLQDWRREDFPLPASGATLRRQGREIEQGRGFAFLRGLPVQRWGDDMARAIYWGISLHLGLPIRQNAAGDRLVAVRDLGIDKDAPTARGPYGRGDLHFHSDFADVVGLLCLRTAKSGGVSRIASSMAILQRMRRERPEFVPLFEAGFHFYRKGEEALDEPPVSKDRIPMLDLAPGRTKFLFWPAFAKQAAQFSGRPLAPLEADALAYVNALAHTPEFFLDTHFQPGDIQYLNNYRILHSRTDFEDWPEPHRKRHLERIWLCTDAQRAFPPRFADLHEPHSLVRGLPTLPPEVVAARAAQAVQVLHARHDGGIPA